MQLQINFVISLSIRTYFGKCICTKIIAAPSITSSAMVLLNKVYIFYKDIKKHCVPFSIDGTVIIFAQRGEPFFMDRVNGDHVFCYMKCQLGIFISNPSSFFIYRVKLLIFKGDLL